MNEVCRVISESASELKIQSTEEGIRLYSFVTYYVEDLKVSWYHKESKVASTDRVKNGVTGEQLWLQINEPTEKDKGKYTMELFDGNTTHKRTVDLSGQGKRVQLKGFFCCLSANKIRTKIKTYNNGANINLISERRFKTKLWKVKYKFTYF
nr:PREDICTED: myomesin-1-like [Latimeria chalumnae]|eukprot:XP_006014501.1 PREDICTED: myomesin-1-like [Latimeria chalumnae]